jgi:membrane protease YdiL (CAAX protease family)
MQTELGPAASKEIVSPRWAAAVRRFIWIAAGYLAWLTVAELVSTLGDPRVGLSLHAALLIALIYHAARKLDDPFHHFLLALAFAPFIRLMSYSLPLADFPQIAWYFIISVPLFVAAYLAARIMGYSEADLGLQRGSLPVQLLIGLTGLTLGYAEYRILAPAPLADSFTWQDLWLPALVLLVSTGFFEELIFRGLMQRAAGSALGPRLGVVYTALVFAVLHAGYKSVVDVVFVFAVGIFFGWIVQKTGSLLGVTLAHGLTNIMLFLIMPYLAAAGAIH